MEDEFLSIQPKLKVGPVNDIYEQEADRVADKVMKMPQPQATQNSGIYSGNQVPYVNVQRNATHQTVPSSVPSIVHKVLRSPGQRIDTATRVFMESRFGQDFSDVRIHTDKLAAESAQSINALAYTVGGDVVFGTGQYAPGITKGKQLLAHELTHVIQQGGSENSNPMIRPQLAMTEPGDRFETEADRASTLVTSDERIHISNRLNTSEAMIARSGDCPSTFELVWKCGLGVIGCVATVLAGIAVSPTGIGLAAAILAVIAACGGAGTVCGELLGKYVTCNWPPDRSRAQAELENPVTTEMAEVAV